MDRTVNISEINRAKKPARADGQHHVLQAEAASRRKKMIMAFVGIGLALLIMLVIAYPYCCRKKKEGVAPKDAYPLKDIENIDTTI